MIIEYHKDFTKSYKRLSSKIKTKLKQRLLSFEKDEFNPILNNHLLKGNYKGYRSINVTGDIRAVFEISGDKRIFVDVDSHSNLYK